VVDPRLAVHAHHAQVERVRGRESAQAQQRQGYGNLRALSQSAHLLHRARFDDAMAGQDHRPLGIADQLRGLLQPGLVHVQHGMGPIGARPGGGKVEDGRGLLRVLGNIHQHRAGTAGLGDLEGVADGGRNVFSTVDQEVVLGHRQGDAGDVHFLKGVGAQHLAGDLAGNADHGDGIQHGRGDAGDKVSGAGAAGGHTDATLPEARA